MTLVKLPLLNLTMRFLVFLGYLQSHFTKL